MRKELSRSKSCNPRHLVSVVDVGMQADLLPHLPALLREINQGMCPIVFRIQNAHRENAKAL